MSAAQSPATPPIIGSSAPRRPVHNTRRLRAYSLIEMLLTLLIIQMISALVIYSVSNVTSAARLDQLGKRVVGAMCFARMLAMSSGQPCKVDFNATNQTVKVYLGSATTPVSNSMFPGGQCSLNLTADQGIAGATITGASNAVVVSSGGSTIYRCTYGCLGTRTDAPDFSQPMSVTVNYGSLSKTLTIPNVGDPN